jgi:two-component system cell cycle sensor histidine kinase/response regulator CckA
VAAGVAHDFNNVLMVILGMAGSLKGGADPRTTEAAGAIEEAATRATKLARLLLAFGRRQALELRRVNVEAVVRDAEPLLRSFASENRLALDLEGGAFVRADPTQLQQVLCNLVGNAADAMPEPGTVSLRVAGAAVGDLARVPEWDPGPLGAVAIEVRDTGTGISPEVRARLFEPFFTTKAPGKGTGLGLASVHGIVTQSGGAIAVESGPGGTSFVVFLPRVAPG